MIDSEYLKLHPVLLFFFFFHPLFNLTNGERMLRNLRKSRRAAQDRISRNVASRALTKFLRHSQVCVFVADAEWGGPVLYGLSHHQELLWRTRGLYKNQELRRRCGCDRAGRRISFRDAGAGGGQICRCRSVGRRENGNCAREAELDYLA